MKLARSWLNYFQIEWDITFDIDHAGWGYELTGDVKQGDAAFVDTRQACGADDECGDTCAAATEWARSSQGATFAGDWKSSGPHAVPSAELNLILDDGTA